MTDLPEVPTAKVGDRLSLQTAPRPVMALGMGEEASEVQVMGLVPNAADGCRVAIGAGMCQQGVGVQMTLCALLDPQQALETSAMLATLAVQAAMLRGEPLKAEPSPELLAMASNSGFATMEEAEQAAHKAPGLALLDQQGNAVVAPGDAMGVHCFVNFTPADQFSEPGVIGISETAMPDGQTWFLVLMRRDDDESRQAVASLPLASAITLSDLLAGRVLDAAKREQEQQGKPS